MDLGGPKHLIHIDIAQASHQFLLQEQGLDGFLRS